MCPSIRRSPPASRCSSNSPSTTVSNKSCGSLRSLLVRSNTAPVTLGSFMLTRYSMHSGEISKARTLSTCGLRLKYLVTSPVAQPISNTRPRVFSTKKLIRSHCLLISAALFHPRPARLMISSVAGLLRTVSLAKSTSVSARKIGRRARMYSRLSNADTVTLTPLAVRGNP